jgi:hypothetical protein
MSEWLVSVGTYGWPDPIGFIEAETALEALDRATPIYGYLCAENEMLVVIGREEKLAESLPPAPPRPTVWSRLREWEV